MSGWEMAYENQIVTWGFWQTEWAQHYAYGFKKDVVRKGRGSGELYDLMPQIESNKLLQADPIYVDEDMEKLWEAAAKDFRPEPFESTDLICPAGFVYLPYPQYMYDLHNKACGFRAIAWSPTVEGYPNGKLGKLGLSISLYSHVDDDDDYGKMRDKVFPEGTLGNEIKRYPLTLMHLDAWNFGESFEDAIRHQAEWGRTKNLTKQQMKYASFGLHDTWRKIQALLRLMQQHITVPEPREAPRATRRRAQRKGFEVKPVTVIRLRRAKKPRDDDHEPKDVDWSHRWLVGMHWRNQWYPSLGIHRQKLILPYIKGPENKPLRVREKRAFELVQ